MTQTGFDPEKFKQAQLANWNAISGGWSACQADFETGAAAVTEQLIDLAGVKAGHRVLDVGTGTGEPALTVADLVGSTGRVVGVDLAPGMVEIATERAAGLDNVEFQVGDVDSLDLPEHSFDAVLSRFGLMFAIDHVATFRSLAKALVPGGVLAAAVWSESLADVPMLSLGYQVLAARLELPPATGSAPGPFAMGNPDKLRSELVAAGFTGVEVTPFLAPFLLDSPERYAEFNKAASPPSLMAMLADKFGTGDDPETWSGIADAVRPYQRADGKVSLPSKALLFRGTVPVN